MISLKRGFYGQHTTHSKHTIMGLSYLFCCCMCYSWKSEYFTIIWWGGGGCQNSFRELCLLWLKNDFSKLSINKLLWFKHPLQFSQDQIAQGPSSYGIPSPLLTVTMRSYLLCFNHLTSSNTRIGKSQSLLSTATYLYSLTSWKTSTNACRKIFSMLILNF